MSLESWKPPHYIWYPSLTILMAGIDWYSSYITRTLQVHLTDFVAQEKKADYAGVCRKCGVIEVSLRKYGVVLCFVSRHSNLSK